MDLTRDLVEAKAAEYAEEEPLSVVEEEQVEGLPDAFASGEYGWRDAEWVVQWHYRRYLGDYPDAERRAGESIYGENDFEAIRDAIAAAVEADGVDEKTRSLTGLSGVDVPVASAFLQFVDPGRFVVMGEPEWSALEAAGELDVAYPDGPSVDDYEAYLGACRSVADRLGCDILALQRALWRLARGS